MDLSAPVVRSVFFGLIVHRHFRQTPSMLQTPRVLILSAALAGVAVAFGSQPAASAADRPAVHATVPAPPVNKYGELCAACHQANGAGLEGAFPPLAGSEWVNGPAIVPIAIVLHGLQGEISVKGKTYNGAMMAWGTVLNDDDLAATLTYVRSQWGNRAAPVTAAQVRAVRARLASRKTPFTAAELKALK
jgi:mono/diheme cytochrome c family protein